MAGSVKLTGLLFGILPSAQMLVTDSSAHAQNKLGFWTRNYSVNLILNFSEKSSNEIVLILTLLQRLRKLKASGRVAEATVIAGDTEKAMF